MAVGSAEVVVWAEGLIECGNQVEEVEKGLSAALAAEGALSSPPWLLLSLLGQRPEVWS